MTDISSWEDCAKAIDKLKHAWSKFLDSLTGVCTKLYYILCMEQVEGLYFEKSKRWHYFRYWSNRKRKRR